MNFELWLGPYIWGPEGWGPPDGAEHWLDLGSTAACGQPGKFDGDVRPMLFCSTAPGVMLKSDWLHLASGDPREIKTDAKQQSAWESLLGYAPQGDSLDQWIVDHFMSGSDPLGLDAVKPIMPFRRLTLYFANEAIVDRTWDRSDPHFNKICAAKQTAFREVFEHEKGSDPRRPPDGFHEKYLGTWCQEYRVPFADAKLLFVPVDLRGEVDQPRQPTTTITESFNQSDSTTPGPDQTWSEVSNDVQTIGNTFTNVSLAVRCDTRCEADLSGDNHKCECDLVTFSALGFTHQAGPGCRYASAANTYYSMVYRNSGISITLDLSKIVTGTLTAIEAITESPSPPDTMRVSAGEDGTGSTIRGNVNGTQKFSVTDTAISTGTRGGLRSRSSTADAALMAMDNFLAEDYVAAGQPTMRRFGGVQFAGRNLGNQCVRVY